jgi:hypothetical protein
LKTGRGSGGGDGDDMQTERGVGPVVNNKGVEGDDEDVEAEVVLR